MQKMLTSIKGSHEICYQMLANTQQDISRGTFQKFLSWFDENIYKKTITVKEETLYLHQIDIKWEFDFWEQFRKTMTFSESLMEMCENRSGLCLAFCPLLAEYVESKWLDI